MKLTELLTLRYSAAVRTAARSLQQRGQTSIVLLRIVLSSQWIGRLVVTTPRAVEHQHH